jgi:hypothetical protein
MINGGTAECTNLARVAWGPFSNTGVIAGFHLWADDGRLLFFGSLQSTPIIFPGQTIAMASGALPVRFE